MTRELLAEIGIKALPRVIQLCGMFEEEGRESCYGLIARESGRYTGEGEGFITRDAYCFELPERWRDRCYTSQER